MAAKKPKCPANSDFRMERLVSAFAVMGKFRELSVSDDTLSPDKYAAAMRLSVELEKLSEENLGPQQIGRALREASQLTGKGKDSIRMQELLGRLDAGEDLQQVEDQIESMLDDVFSCPEKADEKKGTSSKLRRFIDPHLYEIQDYL